MTLPPKELWKKLIKLKSQEVTILEMEMSEFITMCLFLQMAAVDFLLKCSFYFQPIHSTFESPTLTFHHAL